MNKVLNKLRSQMKEAALEMELARKEGRLSDFHYFYGKYRGFNEALNILKGKSLKDMRLQLKGALSEMDLAKKEDRTSDFHYFYGKYRGLNNALSIFKG